MNLLKLNYYKKPLLAGFTSIVLLQWAHFSMYFQQPVGLSLVWSLVDWSVWFVLAVGLFSANKSKYAWPLGAGFILLCGPCHILLSTAVYHLLSLADKTILESFFHLTNKRWLQNIFIGSTVVLIAMYLRKHFELKQSLKQSGDLTKHIVVEDGKHSYQLDVDNVLAVVAAKNYLSIHTLDKEIVIRDTLKNMQNRLTPNEFIQVSRSALVKRSEIAQIERYSKASYRAVLTNKDTINIGRTFVESVQHSIRLSQ